MMIENPIDWFLSLPVVLQLTILGLGLAALQQFRQGHIGRIGIAAAGILIIQQAYPVWNQLSSEWRLYSTVAGLFAIVAGFSYITKTSLPSEFYRAAFLLFGGGTIVMILWVGFPI